MKNISHAKQVLIILSVFIFSRILTSIAGIHLNIWALSAYWQYLDIETLRHHLLTGIWFDHAQPPVFNIFLGLILKISGNHTALVFALILKIISLTNSFLLFYICRKLTPVPLLPLLAALIYLVSPATLIFECELFYTTTISLFLLTSVFSLILFSQSGKTKYVAGFILPLVLLCLTRSVYHIFWLLMVISVLLIYFRKSHFFQKLLVISLAGILLVSGWYIKNKILFGKLTTSTWIGMNMARNVFHDNEVSDSGRIEAYPPFSKISTYRRFLDSAAEIPFRGLNDRDLLREMKNDSFINETEVSYIQVSDLYQKASLQFIKKHPGAYLQNVVQSFILYFTPATMYSLAVEQSDKIKFYDVIYSANLTHFAKGKQQRRILLTLSALPKMAIYFFVFFVLLQYCWKSREINAWNLFMLLTILFVFGISSFFEHYENMRFRYETEPLFLILAAEVFGRLYSRYQIRKPRTTVKDLTA